MKFFSNINNWIILLFLIRLYGITNPPLEISHNWRQAQTGMVTRGFEEDPSIFHPRVLMDGGREIAMEFPLFNYLVFLTNKLFGFEHWYGRLINLLVTSAGLLFFNFVIRRIISEPAAFYATLILGVSVFFSFGRKIMPDTFSASLVMIGIYLGYSFMRETKTYRKMIRILLTVFFISAGVLSKLPVLALYGFFVLPLFSPAYSLRDKTGLLAAILFSLVPVYGWYGYWNEQLYDAGALRIIFPLSLTDGVRETFRNLPGVLEKFYFSTLNSYVALLCFLAGLYFAFKRKEKWLLLIFTGCFLAFLVFVLKSATFFYYHNYYIIPLAPAMAMVAGYGISQISLKPIRLGFLAILISEAVLNQQHDFRLRNDMLYKTTLENVLERFSNPDEKIFINTGPSLQMIYFANRKGWNLDRPSEIVKANLDSISGKNYALIVLEKNTKTVFDSTEFHTLYKDAHFQLLKPRR